MFLCRRGIGREMQRVELRPLSPRSLLLSAGDNRGGQRSASSGFDAQNEPRKCNKFNEGPKAAAGETNRTKILARTNPSCPNEPKWPERTQTVGRNPNGPNEPKSRFGRTKLDEKSQRLQPSRFSSPGCR